MIITTEAVPTTKQIRQSATVKSNTEMFATFVFFHHFPSIHKSTYNHYFFSRLAVNVRIYHPNFYKLRYVKHGKLSQYPP